MNKGELVELVAGETGDSKAAAGRAVDAVLGSIVKGLTKDKTVQLVGFGTFNVRQRKARQGRNPQTGETITIQASRTVGFKPGKELKNSLVDQKMNGKPSMK